MSKIKFTNYSCRSVIFPGNGENVINMSYGKLISKATLFNGGSESTKKTKARLINGRKNLTK